MTLEQKVFLARRSVNNLWKAIKEAETAEKPQALINALLKQLRAAQAKLAELTGSTEP